MTKKKTLTDEELENVTGGTTYYQDTIPEGAVIFNMPPENMSVRDYTCSNIGFNGLTEGKNNGRLCDHCRKIDYYSDENGTLHSCCLVRASDFRKID